MNGGDMSGQENNNYCCGHRSRNSRRSSSAKGYEEIRDMQFIFWAAVFIGAMGIIYTAYGLVRLNDYFYEVYGYDRNSHT